MPTRTDPTGDRSSDCPARPRQAITWTKEEFTGGCNGVRWHARLLPIGNGFWIERWKDKRGVKQPWTLVCHGFGYRQPLNAKSRPPRQKLCASSPSNCPPPSAA